MNREKKQRATRATRNHEKKVVHLQKDRKDILQQVIQEPIKKSVRSLIKATVMFILGRNYEIKEPIRILHRSKLKRIVDTRCHMANFGAKI